jgi:hypothetical protein
MYFAAGASMLESLCQARSGMAGMRICEVFQGVSLSMLENAKNAKSFVRKSELAGIRA